MTSNGRQPQQTISPKQKRAPLLTERVSGKSEAPIVSGSFSTPIHKDKTARRQFYSLLNRWEDKYKNLIIEAELNKGFVSGVEILLEVCNKASITDVKRFTLLYIDKWEVYSKSGAKLDKPFGWVLRELNRARGKLDTPTERPQGNLEAPIASICPMSNRIKQPTLKEVNRALSTLDPANFRDREHLEDTAYILAVLNRLTKRVSGSLETPIDNPTAVKAREDYLFKLARQTLKWAGFAYDEAELADLVMLELLNIEDSVLRDGDTIYIEGKAARVVKAGDGWEADFYVTGRKPLEAGDVIETPRGKATLIKELPRQADGLTRWEVEAGGARYGAVLCPTGHFNLNPEKTASPDGSGTNQNETS